MSEHINPYLRNRKKEIELNNRKKLIEAEIDKIKRELRSKTDMLMEVHKNHVKSYDEQIEELKKSCTHRDEYDNLAASLTHRDILISVDSGFKRSHFCELCGAKFDGQFIEFNKMKSFNVTPDFINKIDADLGVDDALPDTLEFDPNFNFENFMRSLGFIENK